MVRGMREFRECVDIDATVERAWSVLADLERWPEWTPSVTKVEPLDPGLPAPGWRVRIEQPKLTPATWTITEWDPPRGFVWVARRPGLRTIAGHELTARKDGCSLTLALTFSGALAGIAAFASRRLIRHYLTLEARGMKARSEALG